MDATLVGVIGLIVVALLVWLLHRRNRESQAISKRDSILQELRDIEGKRQGLIDEAADRGVTISTDRALAHVERLRDAYVSGGQQDAAREVERVIREFRDQNGPEIPIEKAYALMREIEATYGQR